MSLVRNEDGRAEWWRCIDRAAKEAPARCGSVRGGAPSVAPKSRKDLMQEIEALALSVCRSLAQGQPPVIQFERRSYWLGSADSTRASTAEDEENAEGEAAATADAQQQHRLCWGYARSARSFAITLRLLAQIFSNLTSDVVSTKRELYYSDVNLFKCQQAADAGIENIVMLLKTPRHSLHVVANPKGVFVGNVAMAYEGKWLDGDSSTIGWPIPTVWDRVGPVEVAARYVLVLEKYSAFQRVASSYFWRLHGPCIVVCGKGYPDVATRVFVHRLKTEFSLPVFAVGAEAARTAAVLALFIFARRMTMQLNTYSRLGPSRR
eukprot:TRINITY_DN4692_c0_g1_i2.p1 TRINITY_DN4692_c0_g1~~TRINITY_DN4692_c0_g1_i2.p1  ORF type:complete len:321 (+),score=70.35 TRINITY_DN4692_c0_g1_i2:38-1000(+)